MKIFKAIKNIIPVAGFGMTSALLASLMCAGNAYAVNPSGSTIYGYRADSASDQVNALDLGWYEISTAGKAKLLWLDETEVLPTYFISGWVRDGKLGGLYGNRSTCLEIEYDVETGKLTNVREIDIAGENAYKYMFTAAYNPDDDYVYGFSFDEKFEKDFFVRAPVTDLDAVEIIRRMPDDYTLCMSLCFNTKDHHIYGIDFLGDLIRIDTKGNFEVAASYGLKETNLGNWASGMTYSPLDNCYFWNRQLNTFDSSWVSIDADTYEFKNVKDFDFRILYTVVECLDSDGDEAGPARPKVESRALTADGKGVDLMFRAPLLAKNGDALVGILKWKAIDLKDNKELSGNTAVGDAVDVNFSALSDGEHTIQFYCMEGENRGVSKFVNIWVGSDKPDRVRNIAIAADGSSISAKWDAVTVGAHGGVINKNNVKYALYVKNQKVAETSDCNVKFDLPAGFRDLKVEVKMTAECDGMTGDPAYSNELPLLLTQTLPYTLQPTEDQANSVIILNPDEDKSEWKFAKDFAGKNAFFCPADQQHNSDDWLILPPLQIDDASKTYAVTLNVSGNSNSKKDEYVEVMLGTSPEVEDMEMAVIIPNYNVSGTSVKNIGGTFTVDEPGEYYVGVHCISKPAQSGIYASNISVFEGTAGVDSVIEDSSEAAVSVADGEIVIEASAGQRVVVYTTSGRCAYAGIADGGEIRVPAEAGIYIVKCDTTRTKVQVK